MLNKLENILKPGETLDCIEWEIDQEFLELRKKEIERMYEFINRMNYIPREILEAPMTI